MNKKLKSTFVTLSMGVVLSVPIMLFVSHSQKQDEKTNVKQTYEFDFRTYKLIESIQKGTGPNLEEIYKKMDVNEDFQFNIKLITNVSDDFDEGVTDEEKFDFFHKENSKAVQNILKTFKKEITYTFISDISPIVKIRVKKKDLEKIFKFLEKEKSIRIFSYDKEMPFVDIDKFVEAAIPDSNCIAMDWDTKLCIAWMKEEDPNKSYTDIGPHSLSSPTFYDSSKYKGNYKSKLNDVSASYDWYTSVSLGSNDLPFGLTPTKVGVWEGGSINKNSYVWNHMKIMKPSNKANSWHKSVVASIIGGIEGVDKFSQIYDVNYTTPNTYGNFDGNKMFSFYALNNLEEDLAFIVKEKIDIVNGSFGYGHPEKTSLTYRKVFYYDNVALYLDYISRKYGVTFIFSAGNNDDSVNETNRRMHGMKLSMNSIKVGALNGDNTSRANFSSYKHNGNSNLTNTSVTTSAPGTNFYVDPEIDILPKEYRGENVDGTSFSTPIVTGVLSRVLRENPELRKKPSGLLVLTALGSKMLLKYQDKQRYNHNNEIGYGMIDYYEVEKAARNVRNYQVQFEPLKSSIVDTVEFEVNNGESIKAAAAWLYNSSFTNSFDNSILKNTNKNNWRFLSDYDLFLERQNPSTRKWEGIYSSNSNNNNIEKIYYANAKKGKYRLVLRKMDSYTNPFPGLKTPYDQVSLSYFIDKK